MSDVLIVEDDPALREALAETMNLAGHSYLAAKDGKEHSLCWNDIVQPSS